MKKRCLMIGAGGMARGWIRRFLPTFADRMEIVALVDIDAKALAEQGDFLGLSAEARYAEFRAAFRHEIPHSLLVEGGVHHLDMLRNLADSRPVAIAGYEWNRPWSSFKGESNANYVMRMANGVVAHYEGTCSGAGHQNSWHCEYYRAECEGGQVTVDSDAVVRVTTRDNATGAVTIEEVPARQPAHTGHEHVIDAHLTWLAGGPKPETVLEDNIWSNAALFGAIEASAKGKVVDVAAMVARAAAR